MKETMWLEVCSRKLRKMSFLDDRQVFRGLDEPAGILRYSVVYRTLKYMPSNLIHDGEAVT